MWRGVSQRAVVVEGFIKELLIPKNPVRYPEISGGWDWIPKNTTLGKGLDS